MPDSQYDYRLSCFSPLPPSGSLFGLDALFLFTIETPGTEPAKMLYKVRIDANQHISSLWEDRLASPETDLTWLRPLFFALDSFIEQHYRMHKSLPATMDAYRNGQYYNGVRFLINKEDQLGWKEHVIVCR